MDFLDLLLKLIMIQVVVGFVLSNLRGISLKHYLREMGYKAKKKAFGVRVSEAILSYIRLAVPLFGALIIVVMLFASDDTMFKSLLQNNQIERL